MSSQIAGRQILSLNQSSTCTERLAKSNAESIQSSTETAKSSVTNDQHFQNIAIAIERFSRNTFNEIILRNNIDYSIFIDSSDLVINGHIKCGCHVSIQNYF